MKITLKTYKYLLIFMLLMMSIIIDQRPRALQYTMEAVILGNDIEGKDRLFRTICNNPDNNNCQLRLRNTWEIKGNPGNQADISINYDIMDSTFILKKADLALITLDLSEEFATSTAKVWKDYVQRNSNLASIVLIGMNCCNGSALVNINHKYLYDFSKQFNIPYFPVDHNTGEGIENIRSYLCKQAQDFYLSENENLFSSVDISMIHRPKKCC